MIWEYRVLRLLNHSQKQWGKEPRTEYVQGILQGLVLARETVYEAILPAHRLRLTARQEASNYQKGHLVQLLKSTKRLLDRGDVKKARELLDLWRTS